MKRCPRCLLPDTVPGLTFDAAGLCDICQVTPPASKLHEMAREVRQEMERIIDANRGARPYECVLAYSGGKDSSYTLRMLVEEYGLRVVAVTIDNGFLSTDTFGNCRAVTSALGVDHVLFTPSQKFMQRMYRTSAVSEDMHSPASIQRASSICSSCINLVNTHVLQKALEMGAPLVAGGYLGGQLPRDASTVTVRPGLQVKLRTALVNRFARAFGEEARSYFELARNPSEASKEIVIINPMLGRTVTEEEIITSISELGWKRPKDTGKTSTNCRLNDLGVYIHTRRHGFHPYAFEIAEQLRQEVVTREEALTKLETLPTAEDVGWIIDKIGLPRTAL